MCETAARVTGFSVNSYGRALVWVTDASVLEAVLRLCRGSSPVTRAAIVQKLRLACKVFYYRERTRWGMWRNVSRLRRPRADVHFRRSTASTCTVAHPLCTLRTLLHRLFVVKYKNQLHSTAPFEQTLDTTVQPFLYIKKLATEKPLVYLQVAFSPLLQ